MFNNQIIITQNGHKIQSNYFKEVTIKNNKNHSRFRSLPNLIFLQSALNKEPNKF